ncbi:43kDa postsynaptic protein [Trema orientale]|uniref:43kDa postsynaptic protein n=1 Tax=Trema orientale TaxID=63057 RepID=A0A2P5FSA0_TREOI|nr:43kDa postsynaptic protein [Trema orientale]
MATRQVLARVYEARAMLPSDRLSRLLSLPTFRFSDLSERELEPDDQFQCTACQFKLNTDEDELLVMFLPCGHVFHRTCAIQFVELQMPWCPLVYCPEPDTIDVFDQVRLQAVAVPGGGVEAVVPGGGVEVAMPGRGVEVAVPGGGLDAAVPGGGVDAAVPGGGVEVAVPGGGVDAAVPGGGVDAAVPGANVHDDAELPSASWARAPFLPSSAAAPSVLRRRRRASALPSIDHYY